MPPLRDLSEIEDSKGFCPVDGSSPGWGCWDKRFTWRDTTGKHRDEEIAQRDKDVCYKPIPRPTVQLRNAERQIALNRALDCMKRRGWFLDYD